MEPFDQGYHTDSGDEAPGELQWPSSNVSASLSARHAALMRDELEISPLVPAVPPMPGERSSDNLPGPGLPSSFKTSNQAAEHPQLALKKRKAGPDVFDKDDFSTQSSFESSQPTPKESTKKADFIGEKRSIEACDGSKQIEEDTAPTKRLKPDVMQANQVNPASRSNIRDIVLGCASPSKPSDVSKGDHMRVQTSHDEAAELKNENCGKVSSAEDDIQPAPAPSSEIVPSGSAKQPENQERKDVEEAAEIEKKRKRLYRDAKKSPDRQERVGTSVCSST